MSIRVFLAEDNEDLARLMAKRLAERSWSVVRAGTAEEATARLRGDRFDAVVLDYQLPDGTGLELLGVVRESSPSTPVLFLTAHGSEEVALQALGLGATDYMQKSGSMLDELPTRLAGLLDRSDDVREASRVVPVEAAHAHGHAAPRPRAGIDVEEARKVLTGFVHGDVLGAGVFDGAGAPIATLLPKELDPSVLGASLLQVHAQVGVVGRLNRLSPKGYVFAVETDLGTLACTTVGGRCLVAVLVKQGSSHARERLESLAERVR